MQRRNVLARTSEHSLLVVAVVLLLLRGLQVRLRLFNLHFLEHLLVCSALLKVLFVPFLEGDEQFLFVDIDLRLSIKSLLLVDFQTLEHVSVLAFQVFLFSEHDQLLLVNHVFDVLLVHLVIIAHLVTHGALSALLLLAVKLILDLVDCLLGAVQLVSDVLDLLAVVFDALAQADDVVFDLLAF